MNLIETGSFPINDIIIGDRLRQLNQAWVSALASMIAESTLQTPVSLIAFADGSLHLGAGAHRMAAVKLLGWSDIPAHLYEPQTDQPEFEPRMLEVMDNVGRRELSALDRAGHIAELDRIYKELYPDTKRGVAGGKARQNSATAMFAVADEIANRVGIGQRTVYAAVALWNALEAEVRSELQSMDLAHNQAQLVQLSKVEPERQSQVLALMSGDEPKARKVADALSILENWIDPKNPDQEQYDRLIKAWAKADRTARNWFADVLIERGFIKRNAPRRQSPHADGSRRGAA